MGLPVGCNVKCAHPHSASSLPADAVQPAEPRRAVNAAPPQRLQAGQHQGKLPLGQRLLVIYHHFEDPHACPADEEIQMIRTNFLFFLRCTLPSAHCLGLPAPGRLPVLTGEQASKLRNLLWLQGGGTAR